jgi:hypothetical protein
MTKSAVARLQATRDVADHGDPRQGLDVGIVRVRLKRVPEEDEQIDLAFGDAGARSAGHRRMARCESR